MGSVNPVCILPEKLKSDAAEIAAMYVRSVTNGMGQFCTKPGLQLVPDNEDLPGYIAALSAGILQVRAAPMLHPGIAASFAEKRKAAVLTAGVSVEAVVAAKEPLEAIPTLASVSAETFLKNPALHGEVFGPFSLLIKCRDRAEMLKVIQALEGQLTATIIGTEAELMNNAEIIESCIAIAGRVIINGVPTGVEVCPSMVHGGPFPASSDSRFTAVGLPAIRRFLRPLCYQNFPQALLPEELKDENPGKIWRLVNNQRSRENVRSHA
jgi:alpha-ketoglutaric semialdehyde dehydrogenase